MAVGLIPHNDSPCAPAPPLLNTLWDLFLIPIKPCKAQISLPRLRTGIKLPTIR